jgi:hypothetical protein
MAMWWQLFSNGALHPLPLLVGLALATGVAPAASCRFPFSDPSGTSTVEYDWHAGADIVRTTSIGWEGPTGRWSVIQADLGTGVGGQSTHQFYDAMGAVNRSFRVVYQTNDDGSRGPALDCTTQEGDFLDLDGLQFLRQGPFDPQEVEDVFLTVGESDDEVKMCTEKLGEVTVGRSRMAVWGSRFTDSEPHMNITCTVDPSPQDEQECVIVDWQRIDLSSGAHASNRSSPTAAGDRTLTDGITPRDMYPLYVSFRNIARGGEPLPASTWDIPGVCFGK